MYSCFDPWFEAAEAFHKFYRGAGFDSNGPFYQVFEEAWDKESTLGQPGFLPLTALPLSALMSATFLNATLGWSGFDGKTNSEGQKHMYRKLSVSVSHTCLG